MSQIVLSPADVVWCMDLFNFMNTPGHKCSWIQYLANSDHSLQIQIESLGWTDRTVIVRDIDTEHTDIHPAIAFLKSGHALRNMALSTPANGWISITIDELLA